MYEVDFFKIYIKYFKTDQAGGWSNCFYPWHWFCASGSSHDDVYKLQEKSIEGPGEMYLLPRVSRDFDLQFFHDSNPSGPLKQAKVFSNSVSISPRYSNFWKALRCASHRGVKLHTAESIFSSFVIEYLGEIETEFKNTLACLSGAQMGSNREKNWRSKISWHTPFKKNTTVCSCSDEQLLFSRLDWGKFMFKLVGRLAIRMYSSILITFVNRIYFQQLASSLWTAHLTYFTQLGKSHLSLLVSWFSSFQRLEQHWIIGSVRTALNRTVPHISSWVFH